MPSHWADDPKHWRDRAAAMRTLAALANDVEAASIMFSLADDYDKLADRAPQRAPRTSYLRSKPKAGG
jgi:hypothetical protein